jgi:hypothetical protein
LSARRVEDLTYEDLPYGGADEERYTEDYTEPTRERSLREALRHAKRVYPEGPITYWFDPPIQVLEARGRYYVMVPDARGDVIDSEHARFGDAVRRVRSLERSESRAGLRPRGRDPARRPSRPSFAERLYETRLAREKVNTDFLPLFDHLIDLAEDAQRRGRPQEAGSHLADARRLARHGTTPRYEQEYSDFPRRRGIGMFSKRITSTVTDRDRRARRARRRRGR